MTLDLARHEIQVFFNRKAGNCLVSSLDCSRMSKILRIMNAGKERWQREILRMKRSASCVGENWRLIMPTDGRKLALTKERYSLLVTYSLLLLFSLVTSKAPIVLHSRVKEQLICKARSKT